MINFFRIIVIGFFCWEKSVPKVSTRSLRKRKLKKTRQVASITEIGKKETQAVVEVLHTCSTVDVVWQVRN